MDLVGQERCEHIFQSVLLASLVAAFCAGWVFESISLSYMVLGAGVAVGGLLCTPNWGMFNRHPLTFASAEALEADMAAAVPQVKGRAGGKSSTSR
ncbi:hypothetical protein I4F81_007159 [Pyropia yezoensis]|uniref:Uncharacterized protein n=1 Tax=Pyropia yezoensis TaxID=2788 RepID=A0ACC3C3A9_PYRYE|nr:hypothetical protein I4F81_007159 [Neopyropia yezoensis]|eukprot:contig_10388_g2494